MRRSFSRCAVRHASTSQACCLQVYIRAFSFTCALAHCKEHKFHSTKKCYETHVEEKEKVKGAN